MVKYLKSRYTMEYDDCLIEGNYFCVQAKRRHDRRDEKQKKKTFFFLLDDDWFGQYTSFDELLNNMLQSRKNNRIGYIFRYIFRTC
jgi:hypothetical protein